MTFAPVGQVSEFKSWTFSHLMLVGLKKPLKQGDHFTVTLKLERAGDITFDVPVSGVAASAPL